MGDEVEGGGERGDLRTALLFEPSVDLTEPQEVGATLQGNRRIIYGRGGRFEGPTLTGEVLPGGGDWLRIRPDGVGDLDIRASLRTNDGPRISTDSRGIFHGSAEVMSRVLRGEAVSPADDSLRKTPFFETASEKYGWLNRLVAVGTSTRTPTGVHYTVYAVR